MKKILIKAICFFIPIRKYRTEFKKKMKDWIGGDAASKVQKNAKGNALVSYMKDSMLLSDGDKNLMYHTNRWENREIANIFFELGYNVDCIDANVAFYPKKKYDVIFDIGDKLVRLEKSLKPGAVKFLHLTGSWWKYNNVEEQKRLDFLEQRRGVKMTLERVGENNEAAIEAADICSLVGNEHTLNTYPEKYRNKIKLINLTGSELSRVKQPGEYYPAEKEFLWMGGAGPVHKGLDLLLEVFSKHPEWKLNVMSKISRKGRFYELYKKEMFELSNIKFHGLVMPSSEKFNEIAGRCFAYVNPSCAEATSTATVTALSYGLYPLISRDNGFDLPDGAGMYLDDCTPAGIEKAISAVWKKPEAEVVEATATVQKITLEKFSRQQFTDTMREFIEINLQKYGA